MYKEVWEAAIGEALKCHRKPTNAADRYAVAVTKAAAIIGHLPRKLSKVCSLFLRRGGSIRSTVTGRRRYSSDLLQGGLELGLYEDTQLASASFYVLALNIRSKNFRYIIIFVQNIFDRFQKMKIFLQRKKQITVIWAIYMLHFIQR